jgi:outer membrane protein OmpA-like peptidoglycan-associated protein
MTKALIFGLLISIWSLPVANNSYRLNDIQFEINSSKLDDDQIKELKTVVETIRKAAAEGREKEKFTLWINGNADPSENGAKRLSFERAKIVKEHLINLGLTEGTLITKANGTKRPLTNSSNDTAKRRNARVDFKIGFE